MRCCQRNSKSRRVKELLWGNPNKISNSFDLKFVSIHLKMNSNWFRTAWMNFRKLIKVRWKIFAIVTSLVFRKIFSFVWKQKKSSMSRYFRRTQFVNCFDLLFTSSWASVCEWLFDFRSNSVELWLSCRRRVKRGENEISFV